MRNEVRARARWRSSAAALLALLTVLTLVPARPAAAATNEGITALNALRALAGLPPVQEDATLTAGAAKHAAYMLRNQVIGHAEDPGLPGYSHEGDVAARQSNLTISTRADLTPRDAVHGLMASPFHGIGFLDPRLQRSGAAVARDPRGERWRAGYAINVLGGLGAAPETTTYPIVWPGNGSVLTIRSYDGGENPDPLASCADYAEPTGTPLLVQFATDSKVVGARLTREDGTAVDACVFDQHTYANPRTDAQALGRNVLRTRNAAVVVPREPLELGGRYTASVRTPSMTITWSFEVGDRTDASALTAPRTSAVPVLRTLDAACPTRPEPTAFADVEPGSADAAAIACVALWRVAQGGADGTFAPHREVNRAQLATFVANAITSTGGTLPAAAPDAFDDDAGNPHAGNIDRLAAAGLISGTGTRTFSPDVVVTRGQLATFLVRAYQHRTGTALTAEHDWFADDDHDPHVANIDRAAEAGLLTAQPDGTFTAGAPTTRAAMASAIARLLDLLAAEGLATPTA